MGKYYIQLMDEKIDSKQNQKKMVKRHNDKMNI